MSTTATEKLYKLFTFMELDEISAIIEEHNKTPHLRMAQKNAWTSPAGYGEDASRGRKRRTFGKRT